jgi:cytochrome d ubiquinol oxidase subunit I
MSSSFLLASMFVRGVSSWFIIRKREELLARRSILVAAVFGLLSSLMAAYTGDASARTLSKVQPVKFASMEALFEGKDNAGLVAFAILKDTDKKIGQTVVKDFAFKIEIPGLLSVLTGGDKDAYVQGINDHVMGNKERGILSVSEKTKRGKVARNLLMDYKSARIVNDTEKLDSINGIFKDKQFQDNYFRYFGYSSIGKPDDVIPNVHVSFYSFHMMVILGFLFIMIFATALYLLFKGTITKSMWFLWIALFSIPLPYIASELGWILTEAGRQPWIIQDMMLVSNAVSNISSDSVVITFILFAVLFTALLISEISIMIRQIKTGPRH